MKNVSVLVAVLFLTISSFGQGRVFFNNRTPSGDVPFARFDGTGLGEGFTAQLYLVNGTTLTPLTPTTTFRNTSPAAAFFVNPLDVDILGVPAGSPATFRVRVFETAAGSYEAAAASSIYLFGETLDVNVPAVGGTTSAGSNIPNPPLDGLSGFVLVPEPSTVFLGVLGSAALLYWRRK